MKRILLASAALVAVASTSAEACDFRRTKWNVYFGVIEEDQFAAEAGVLLPPTYVKCKLQFDKYGESFSNTCGVNIITTMGHGQGVSDGDRCHYTDALGNHGGGTRPILLRGRHHNAAGPTSSTRLCKLRRGAYAFHDGQDIWAMMAELEQP